MSYVLVCLPQFRPVYCSRVQQQQQVLGPFGTNTNSEPLIMAPGFCTKAPCLFSEYLVPPGACVNGGTPHPLMVSSSWTPLLPCHRPLHLLINRPQWQIWISVWTLACTRLACGTPRAALRTDEGATVIVEVMCGDCVAAWSRLTAAKPSWKWRGRRLSLVANKQQQQEDDINRKWRYISTLRV